MMVLALVATVALALAISAVLNYMTYGKVDLRRVLMYATCALSVPAVAIAVPLLILGGMWLTGWAVFSVIDVLVGAGS